LVQRGRSQGLSEIVALNSIIEAHIRVAATVESNNDISTESKRSREITVKSEWTAKNLVNPLIGVLSGGAIGAGHLQRHGSCGSHGWTQPACGDGRRHRLPHHDDDSESFLNAF